MAHRSIKRVLGETSLQRKCLALFIVFMTLLVFGSFYSVERIAEKLVTETAIRKGRDLVDAALLRYHWEEAWENDPQVKQLVKELTRDLETQEYGRRFLALEETATTERPADAAEEAILRQLKVEFQDQLRRSAYQTGVPSEGEPGKPAASALLSSGSAPAAADGAARSKATMSGNEFAVKPSEATASIDIAPVRKFQRVPAKNAIYYYQPVYWKNSCVRCHNELKGDAFSRADAALLADQGNYPFRVVKVIIPDRETHNAISNNRAILLAIGIVTVSLAMAALWGILRYFISRPLQHLRDVSEAISRGNTELRADIHSNDEFEELAGAFNRMLRHLTDTQTQLRQVNKDLDGKLDQLAQLNMRLYEMNRLKSDFLTNMSHELRTPLNSIIGFSEVLQGVSTLTDKQQRYAQNIQKSGRLLLEMINDILDLAKIEAGKMDLRLTEFRLEAVLHSQCDMVRGLSEEKNIDLNVHVPPDLPPLFQDQSKIQQIIINLLSNAIKFTPEGGRITVTAARETNERLVLSVADTGVGIPEQDREVIFEKFRQSSATIGDNNLTREYTGSGLGLSIVRELCRLLGGDISVQSELGRGSTFAVVLPWTLPHPSRREASAESQLEDLARAQRLELHAPGHASSLKPQPVASS
jgi:signal transduction histidine kinase